MWLTRFFTRSRRAPVSVDLDLFQQLIIRALRRAGPLTFAVLLAEVQSVRPATQADVTNALLALDASGVIERLGGGAHSQRPYALTKRGRRIARYIPADPRSAMEFYV